MGMGNETFHLPKSRILHLPSLISLKIAECKDLYLSWKTLLSLKLKALALSAERVIEVEDETMMVMQHQTLLRSLAISEGAGAKWVDDIPWISLSSTLEVLYLRGMGEREQLHDGIQHLSSLRHLSIEGCEKLRSLPVWISKLTSLMDLRIDDCSTEFKRRYETGTGDVWHLIPSLFYRRITAASATANESASRNEEEEEGIRKKTSCIPNMIPIFAWCT